MANLIEKASKKFKGERTLSTIIIIIFMLAFWVFSYSSIKIIPVSMTALLSLLATYELIHSVGSKNKVLYAVTMAYSAIQVFLLSYSVQVKWNVVLTVYILALLIIMVAMHEKTKYVDIGVALIGSVAYSYAFSCFMLIKDYYKVTDVYSKYDCYCLFLFVFAASWLTDTGAFLVGRKLGKHKLCPKISPKKSVEGAVGGVIITIVVTNLFYLGYNAVMNKLYGATVFGESPRKYIVISLLVGGLCVLSMFGDLAASVHKRNYGLKDYSNLLPGHGGIMDRFDSSIFVLPAMYSIITTVPNLF